MWAVVFALILALPTVVPALVVWWYVRRNMRILSALLMGIAHRAMRDRERVDVLAGHILRLRQIMREAGVEPDETDWLVASASEIRIKTHNRERLIDALRQHVRP